MKRVAASGLLPLALAITALPATVAVLPGCGVGCGGVANAGLSITVIDAATGAPVCDAIVVATDGDHVETLMAFPNADPCHYFGAYERPGTYDLQASSGGRTTSMTVIVGENDSTCRHVMTREVTLTLPAAAA